MTEINLKTASEEEKKSLFQPITEINILSKNNEVKLSSE